jgi:hypothetical protein
LEEDHQADAFAGGHGQSETRNGKIAISQKQKSATVRINALKPQQQAP